MRFNGAAHGALPVLASAPPHDAKYTRGKSRAGAARLKTRGTGAGLTPTEPGDGSGDYPLNDQDKTAES